MPVAYLDLPSGLRIWQLDRIGEAIRGTQLER